MSLPVHESLSYIGAHYSLCPVELRELWTKAFDSKEGRRKLREILLCALGDDVLQGHLVPVFTCNRFDLYLEGQLSEEVLTRLFRELSQVALAELSQDAASSSTKGSQKGLDLAQEIVSKPESLKECVRILRGQEATVQLFRVASSLDSLVLGEPHILGQLREQFTLAKEMGLASPRLESLFFHAFSAARRVRSETELGKNAVSIGHAAVAVAQRIFDDLGKIHALVLGAGEMGRLASQHLLSKGVAELSVANRSPERRLQLCQELGRAQPLDLETALERIPSFDLVIVATASREALVLPKHLSGFDRKRRGKPGVIVDISVPRNVDPECSDVSSSLYLFDVDDLDKVMERNRSLREEAAKVAEQLIEQELTKLKLAHDQKEELRHLGAFHRFVKRVVQSEIEKSIRMRGSLSGESEATIIADAVAKKLVSTPAKLARTAVTIPEGEVGGALLALFELSETES